MKSINSKKAAIVGIVGVALALLVAPLSSASADGGSTPTACVKAVGFDGQFLSQAGSCHEGSDGSADDSMIYLLERTDLTVKNIGWAGKQASYKVTRELRGKSEVVAEEPTRLVSKGGYINFNVPLPSEWRSQAELDAYKPSYRLSVEVDGVPYDHTFTHDDVTPVVDDRWHDWSASFELTGPDQWVQTR